MINKKRSYTVHVERKLDEIIQRGGEINRDNILLAEEISYKNSPSEILNYDSFGFVDKFDKTNTNTSKM